MRILTPEGIRKIVSVSVPGEYDYERVAKAQAEVTRKEIVDWLLEHNAAPNIIVSANRHIEIALNAEDWRDLQEGRVP